MQKIYKTAGGMLVAAFVAVSAFAIAVPETNAQQYALPTLKIQTASGTQYLDQYQLILYLLQVIADLQAQLADRDDDDDDDSDGDAEIEITTRSATNIEDEEARLRGEVDFNSSDYAYVWFEWGEDDDDLDEETPHIRRDDDDDEDFSVRITNLDEDERYYFRAVGEDEDGDVDRGSIRDFRTDDDDHDRDEEPDVETGDADDITDDSVELNGEVDMNDFRNGIVFFVFGEDEDQIDDVEDDYDSYSDVDEDGDDLQKVRVDRDLDDEAEYRLDIDGLDDDTEYFYAICVEYEDEDDDETLICGNTEEFETDD